MKKKELWAIGNAEKIKQYCMKDCKMALIGKLKVGQIACQPCREKKCKYTLKEFKNYDKLDDDTIIHLRFLK